VPLVDYWRVPEQRLCDLWEQLLVRKPGDTEMHFEHEIPCGAAAEIRLRI
jgi:hypothetical protein